MLTMSAPRLELTEDEREALEAVARSSSLPHRAVLQAKGLLLAAEGVANNEIARRCDVTPNAVRRWRAKFADEGVEGVGRIRPGRGRPPELSAELIEAIVHHTLHTTPAAVRSGTLAVQGSGGFLHLWSPSARLSNEASPRCRSRRGGPGR